MITIVRTSKAETVVCINGKRYMYLGLDEYNLRRVERYARYGQIASAMRILASYRIDNYEQHPA